MGVSSIYPIPTTLVIPYLQALFDLSSFSLLSSTENFSSGVPMVHCFSLAGYFACNVMT